MPVLGYTQYWAVPIDRIKLVEVPITATNNRLPRQVNVFERSSNEEKQQSQTTQETAFESNEHIYNPQQYVDYGAHTGHNGAFGWYADFPVKQQ